MYPSLQISGQASFISMVNLATCTAVIAQRNHFFHLHQKKTAFRQASNHYKKVLEAATKLAYATKQKSLSVPPKKTFLTFGQWLIVLSTKGKSTIPLLFNGPEVVSSASDKPTCLLKTFLKTLILMIWASL